MVGSLIVAEYQDWTDVYDGLGGDELGGEDATSWVHMSGTIMSRLSGVAQEWPGLG